MRVPFYLYVSNNGTVRALKNGSRLQANEIEIGMTLELPDALFKRPILQANIKIPNEAALPEVIDASVIENVKDAIHASTGLKFNIEVGIMQPEKTEGKL